VDTLDLERIIDDFVFLCFFVGNDFLPHLPSLDIRKGGIDCLMFLYKHLLPVLGGYLTENGDLVVERVHVFVKQFG
jgi:5'-3' exonuclease